MQSLSLLRIAGELAVAAHQVADSFRSHRGGQSLQRATYPLENVGVRRAYGLERQGTIVAENQAEEQAARTEQDRATAGRATQDRHAIGGTGGLVHVVSDPAAGTQDDSIFGPLPDAQQFAA